jgi:6-phosphofructokinase 1
MKYKPKNLIYAQSGGVTPVINASACGVIEAARQQSRKIGKILAAKNGILGVLNEELIDTARLSKEEVNALRYTPGGAFGSCRYQLKSFDENRLEYERIINVLRAHDIGYFLYNGGGDSQDTANKIFQMSQLIGYPLACIGIPKTIDNDLPFTDNSPGFASVAKYIAVSVREASLDVASMAKTSTKVFVLEVMGRHAGWIAAASGLAQSKKNDGPHIILFPEIRFDPKKFLTRIQECVEKYGYAVVVASEGIKTLKGEFFSATASKDAFGHYQLGGVAPVLAQLVKSKLGYKYHWGVADYLQRACRHIASKVDVEQAYQLGAMAVKAAVSGKQGIMLTIIRKKSVYYEWSIGEVDLSKVANVEKKMPRHYITKDGFHITKACRDYLQPLIEGEDYPPYQKGLPTYFQLNGRPFVPKKLKPFSLINTTVST